MSFAIWKFPLDIEDEQLVEMPRDANVLSVQMQHGVPTIWAMVIPTQRKVQRRFVIVGTGHPADHVVMFCLPHLGTVQDGNGLVWHIFDGGEAK